MTIEALYKIFSEHPSVQTDTRKIKAGDIFFALKGPNFNGNNFALKALEAGAVYAVVDENIDAANDCIIKTDDALATLQALAQYHREQFSIPFIAITGSNGKTTTKELVHAVLSAHFTTYTTQGNLNNHIGVPLTLLSIKKDAQMAVIEMGANHQKEIAGYCVYTEPTHGIITNCGKAHLEGFGGVEGVRKGKGELYDYIKAHDAVVFAYDDYDYLHDMSKGIKRLEWYGKKNGIVTGTVLQSEPFLSVRFANGVSFDTIQTQLVGEYNLPNVLCAVIVGKHFNVPDEKIKSAIEAYTPSNSRSQLMEKGSNKIILDAYNANPSSMKLAIENFAKIHADKKILMLGGMMELGEESIAEHRALIELIDQFNWEDVILVGGDFLNIDHSYKVFKNTTEAGAWIKERHINNAYMLIKGSRSIAMEKLLESV